MKGKSKKKLSLYLEVTLMSLFAGVISLLFFAGSRFVLEQQIERYYENPDTTRRYNEKYILKLQRFVTEQKVSAGDSDKLDEWINDNRLIYLKVKRNKEWMYPVRFYMDETEAEYVFWFDSQNICYNIEFFDGTAQVFIIGLYSYNAYMIALVVDITVSFLLFLSLMMLGIRKKILYINRLSREIEILEGGNLEYEIQVQGSDEIADLAKGLNAMKVSFKNQIDEIEHLTKTNQEMITEISHDLRTPLTSVLLYAEILQTGRYEDEQKYLNKIVKRIQHMKDLSDRMLAYSVNAFGERYVCAEYLPIHSALYDELSDMYYYLEEQGLKVKSNLTWEKGQILIYEEYLIRILDNISSNILKYANKQGDILIWNEYFEKEYVMFFENTCMRQNSNTDSYSIGVRNVEIMMKEMNGACEVTQDAEKFRICLRFQYKKD